MCALVAADDPCSWKFVYKYGLISISQLLCSSLSFSSHPLPFFPHCRGTLMSVLDETLGAVEIGVIVSMFLYGIFTVQIFFYYQANMKDRIWLKCLVSQVIDTYIKLNRAGQGSVGLVSRTSLCS